MEIKYIYFIQSGKYVKIGISKDPESRLKQLQVGHPKALELILSHPGNKSVEKAYHLLFKELRGKGEWFKLESPLTEFIDTMKYSGVALINYGYLYDAGLYDFENDEWNFTKTKKGE